MGSPLLLINFDDGFDGSVVLDLPRNWLRTLDPTLCDVERNVTDGTESSGDQVSML